jgi:hypothetical protein
LKVEGTVYEVDPDMAGETVVLLWGLFDEQLFVEFEGQNYGPYYQRWLGKTEQGDKWRFWSSLA